MAIACALSITLVTTIDEHRLLDIAHRAIRSEVLGVPAETYSSGEPPRPVFVTIERSGKVLGCRGDLTARCSDLEQEVAMAARAACAHDPRYRPLTPTDLNGALVTVTVVEEQVRITGVDDLQPSEGLVLRLGDRTGVVLPWEGRDQRTRLRWAYRKAGITEGRAVQLFRLKAERFRG
jgi:AMMECR1 domain-containing protein